MSSTPPSDDTEIANTEQTPPLDATSTLLTKIGWALISVVALAIVVFMAYGIWVLFTETDMTNLVRVLIVLGLIGGLLLVGVVVRDRIIAYRTDKYKNVEY